VKSLDNSVIQVGAWRVDPALDEISRDGQTTKLEPKLMQLLLHLAAHAGQVVSVEQLLDEVWKDVVVTPDSVYHAVAALRRVLGDDSKDPTYIANVMRRGYRLIAPVVPMRTAGAPAPPLQSLHSAAGDQAVKPTVEVRRSQSIRRLIGRRLDVAIIAVLAVVLAYLIAHRFWISKRYTAAQPSAQKGAERTTAAPAGTFAPPPYSIAVLPFVNMSGDKDQEYFSDGLTEEIINSLSRINELQVSARTSSFSFKGKDVKIGTIAQELNVGALLEGSVRRSGRTIRVTAQLNNAVTGFHLWSQTYDRDLKDVLKLQTDIANAVANALKVTLLGDVAAKIEVGGTHNPAAFDAYLRAAKSYGTYQNSKDLEAAIAGYTEAVRLDPDYAIAYADRSGALADFAANFAKESSVRAYLDKAQADGRRAVAIANNLGEGHLALAYVSEQILDFTTASQEYRSALALAPGNASVLSSYGSFAVRMGETEAGLAALHRSVVLDPLSDSYYDVLGQGLLAARRYNDAISTFALAKALVPVSMFSNQWLGLAYYSIGDFQSARTACESRGDAFLRPYCLALVYDKLGRHTDAKSMLATLRATWGETPSTNTYYAMIYAQWGDTAQALDWLESAMRNRDPYLDEVKTSPWLDPLRKEPRFQAVMRALKFPD
jgi:TolB-like protein/DNA-binding winged helix-turn-helix (wHTH) protein/Flp pilus assembly protein TadD